MPSALSLRMNNLVSKLFGLWYEQPDILSKYKRRPEKIEQMCSHQEEKQKRTEITEVGDEGVDIDESH